jgi:murein DD-endopeptidase MepM/ murein hydrolase activator NlpD
MILAAGAAAATPEYAFSEPPKAVEPKGEIRSILVSPLFREPFVYGEHPSGEGSIVGDELGTDCQIVGGVLDQSRSFPRLYRTDGRTNEDWYSWGADVLAPFDGIVVALLPNPRVNTPGTKGKGIAGLVEIKRQDGLTIFYGHVTDFAVRLGEHVKAGQVLAKVGNNGQSYAPHVHVGAFRGLEPLQIRWDQRAMTRFQDEIARRSK